VEHLRKSLTEIQKQMQKEAELDSRDKSGEEMIKINDLVSRIDKRTNEVMSKFPKLEGSIPHYALDHLSTRLV
jgi:hypothetical protein